MKTLKIISGTTLAIIVILLAYAWYLGLFRTMSAEEKMMGSYRFAGLEYTGAYSNAGKNIMQVSEQLKSAGVMGRETFGIYYDDPDLVPEEKCRSYVGILLDEKDVNKTEQLMAKGFRIDSIPRRTAAVTDFPIRSFLSYMIGPVKAYPTLSGFMKEKGYTPDLSMEIYNTAEKKITFIQFIKEEEY